MSGWSKLRDKLLRNIKLKDLIVISMIISIELKEIIEIPIGIDLSNRPPDIEINNNKSMKVRNKNKNKGKKLRLRTSQ